MSEARRFQQLKAHLSYLKLNDAAEALNRVLDAARSERLSLPRDGRDRTASPRGRRVRWIRCSGLILIVRRN